MFIHVHVQLYLLDMLAGYNTLIVCYDMNCVEFYRTTLGTLVFCSLNLFLPTCCTVLVYTLPAISLVPHQVLLPLVEEEWEGEG